MATGTRIRRWVTTVGLVVGVAVGSGVVSGVAAAAVPPDQGGPCAGAKPYPDVSKTNEFCQAIHWAKDEGLIFGYPDKGFHGGVTMDRIAIAAILYRYLTGKTTGPCTSGTSGFNDITTTNQFCNAIRYGKDKGLFVAQGGNFNPSTPVSRRAIAVYLFRSVNILNLPGLPILGCLIGITPELSIGSGFSDVGVLTPNCSEIKFMKDFDLSQGWTVPGHEPEYRPGPAVERQAMVAFLYRFDQVFAP